MVILITLLKATQDGNGLRRAGLIHHHHLEPSLQGFIGLKILLILIKGGAADGPEFSTGKGRLQDVGSVHCAACAASAHKGVDFVDEKDDLSGAVHNLLHNALQTLLKLTLILCARNERAHIQRVHLF